MHDTHWREYDKSLCDAMNTAPFLLVLADAATAAAVMRDVDEACSMLCRAEDDGNNNNKKSSSSNGKPASVATTSTTTTPTVLSRRALASLLRVQCTSPASQSTVQRCIAVHGRVPCVALVDPISSEDELVTYMLDVVQADEHNNNNDKDKENDCSSNNNNKDVSTTLSSSEVEQHNTTHSPHTTTTAAAAAPEIMRVYDFLLRVVSGEEAPAPQGAPPPHDDLFAPTHGVVLYYGRSAVTSTFARLVRGGAVCVCWSERCACCPGIMMLLEALVGHTCRVAHEVVLAQRQRRRRLQQQQHRDTKHDDDHKDTLAKAAVDDADNSDNHNDDKDDMPSPTSYIRYIVCNIDDNDMGGREWPKNARDAHVPCIRAYNRNTGERVMYTYERTAAGLVDFMCCHCLCLDAVACGCGCGCGCCCGGDGERHDSGDDVDALRARIRSVAVSRARTLSEDALMHTLPDDSAAYQAAVRAAASLSSPAASEVCTTRDILACFARARRELPWMRSTTTTTTDTQSQSVSMLPMASRGHDECHGDSGDDGRKRSRDTSEQ